MSVSLCYEKRIDRVEKAEVLVVGGGPAGSAAAIAAARNGASTLLVEREGILGGMATAGLVGPFMTCYDADAEEQIIKGVFEEMVVRAESMGGAIHPSKVEPYSTYTSFIGLGHSHVTPFSSEVVQTVLDEMAREAGVSVLCYTQFVDCIARGGSIEHVIIANKSGLSAVRAQVYIDATGDADVAYAAGVRTELGDEQAGYLQPVTLFFEVENVDSNKLSEAAKRIEPDKAEIRKGLFKFPIGALSEYVDRARANGDWTLMKNDCSMYETNIKGRYKINTTRVIGVDATDARQLTLAHMDAKRQAFEVLKCMRKYIPGCENASLAQLAPSMGVRETRHIDGRYCLTADDVTSGRCFEDDIALCGYVLDMHGNKKDGSGGGCMLVKDRYGIPYRALLPNGCDNLIVAGRGISATSQAASTLRIIPCCMAIGEAAGTAGALAARQHVTPGELDVQSLRETLRAQNAVV